MHTKHLAAGLVIALLSTAGLTACGGDDDNNSSAASTSTAATTTPSSSGTATSGTASTGQIDPSKPIVRLAYVGIKIPGINLYDAQTMGISAAVKKINDAGGFGGRKLVIDQCNSMAQPSTASTCAQKLVAKKPVGLFGCEIAWAATGLKIFGRAGIPSFNCTNLTQDFTDPWSFGIHPGSQGDSKAQSRWMCAQSNIKSATMITQDIPQQHQVMEAGLIPAMKACGKQLTVVYYPITAADLTPSIQQVASKKADFNLINTSGPQTVSVLKGYQAAGIPGTKIAMFESSWDYNTVIKPAGAAAEGAYYFGGWKVWDDTSDSDMTDYFAAMQANGNSKDTARNPNAEYGYGEVMFFYAAAKEIGFDEFNSGSLKQFADTNNGLHIPLARTYNNPGPKDYPQMKQGYVQVGQWKGGKLTPIPGGVADGDGWINGF